MDERLIARLIARAKAYHIIQGVARMLELLVDSCDLDGLDFVANELINIIEELSKKLPDDEKQTLKGDEDWPL